MMRCHAWTSALIQNQRPMLLTRRQILASSVAMAGAIRFLPTTHATAAPEPRTDKLPLTAGTRTRPLGAARARRDAVGGVGVNKIRYMTGAMMRSNKSDGLGNEYRPGGGSFAGAIARWARVGSSWPVWRLTEEVGENAPPVARRATRPACGSCGSRWANIRRSATGA